MLSLSIHSLIVDTPTAKLVVDTCIGNDRNREPMSVMSNLATSYLDDMIAAGYHPESINYVLCTHLHLDHVGWNTRLVNGKWVPTFPKASYLMDKKELAFFGNIDEKAKEDFCRFNVASLLTPCSPCSMPVWQNQSRGRRKCVKACA